MSWCPYLTLGARLRATGMNLILNYVGWSNQCHGKCGKVKISLWCACVVCLFFSRDFLGWVVYREGSFPVLCPGAGPGLGDWMWDEVVWLDWMRWDGNSYMSSLSWQCEGETFVRWLARAVTLETSRGAGSQFIISFSARSVSSDGVPSLEPAARIKPLDGTGVGAEQKAAEAKGRLTLVVVRRYSRNQITKWAEGCNC